MAQANLHAGMKFRWANAYIPWKRFVVSILGITEAVEGFSELDNECEQGDQKNCAASHLVHEARASKISLKVNLTSSCLGNVGISFSKLKLIDTSIDTSSLTRKAS